ncbi:HXXEE domain-containing protein [Leptobacterium flavescens]|uniref:HXXEE domain-containing protein n=1 Tax=Leptobacterium flavescens TaxID=472055 RepID=A0A6P0UHW0_9FLAO|nr:HXXEE domain-containing protein [Leptobacterium flavescens]NER12865.1 HXXEE domain-containing protein [Leptobacterium flavescens]
MEPRVKIRFLILVLVQALHSTEEYIGKLWEVSAPAEYLSGLISSDIETGFLVINVGLFVFGIFCWLFIVRTNHRFAPFFIWFWIVLEIVNGLGHLLWSFYEKNYIPGLWTAPFLLIAAVYLRYTYKKTVKLWNTEK